MNTAVVSGVQTRTPPILKVLLFVGLWLAATAWFRPLMNPDEGRYADVAYEMLRSGDWLVPRLDGMPFFHKPPLFYWISAAAMSVFGPCEFAARLPSLLGATGAAVALWAFLRRWSGAATARTAVIVLVTMPFFFLGSQFANLDMLVAGCISVTILCAVHAAMAKEQGAAWRGALAGAFVAAALGVLAKGLIGLLLPGAIFIAWCVSTRQGRHTRLLFWPVGWLLFLVLAGPWFWKMQALFANFFDYFVVTQHFRRFATTGFNNQQPLWFYLPVIAALVLPWTAWLLVPRWRGAVRPSTPLNQVDWLMMIWFAVIVVFFSLPKSKLIGYVLPALPPLAWLVARCTLSAANQLQRRNTWVRWTAGFSVVFCAVAPFVIGLHSTPTGVRLPVPEALNRGDQIVMLDNYFYDVPFYWHLAQPIPVVADWTASTVVQRDNWQKELFDAGSFAPKLAQRLFVAPAEVASLLCTPKTTWLIGPADAEKRYPWLADAQVTLVRHDARANVWRFNAAPGTGLGCVAVAGAGGGGRGDAAPAENRVKP